jgi:ribonucleoside-diphosphate reductase alpha chain
MPEIEEGVAAQPIRRRLPDERKAIVHHFKVGGYEGYLTIGFY